MTSPNAVSPSDFAKSVARVSKGFCPVHETELTDDHVVAAEPYLGRTFCAYCDAWWTLGTYEGKPYVVRSGSLSKAEIQKLYNREAASTGGE